MRLIDNALQVRRRPVSRRAAEQGMSNFGGVRPCTAWSSECDRVQSSVVGQNRSDRRRARVRYFPCGLLNRMRIITLQCVLECSVLRLTAGTPGQTEKNRVRRR